jgi:hypothetical protein
MNCEGSQESNNIQEEETEEGTERETERETEESHSKIQIIRIQSLFAVVFIIIRTIYKTFQFFLTI